MCEKKIWSETNFFKGCIPQILVHSWIPCFKYEIWSPQTDRKLVWDNYIEFQFQNNMSEASTNKSNRGRTPGTATLLKASFTSDTSRHKHTVVHTVSSSNSAAKRKTRMQIFLLIAVL